MTFSDLKLRVRALLRPGRVEQDLNDELAFHIEREAAKLIEQGMPPAEARALAQARFGSTTVVADDCRDERGVMFFDHTIRDLVYAARSFVRAPLVSVTIISTIAIGLGLIGVLFTVLNVMLFRVDNVPDVNEMYQVERADSEQDTPGFTRADFEAMRNETRAFVGLYAQTGVGSRVDGRAISGSMVTGNVFQVLGVHAAMGRALMPADDQAGVYNPVIVLSHTGWVEKLGSDPDVVGRRLIIHGAPHEIIGVMPERFRGLAVGAPDYWAPLSMLTDHDPQQRGRADRSPVEIIGRLMPGTTPESARAQVEAWYAQHTGMNGTDRRTLPPIVLLPRRGTIPEVMEAAIVFTPLFFVVGLVLLIGCANIANLLLARGVARQKEIGVRLSLGASRPRIIRQLLTESLLLALTASVVGFFISRWALDAAITFVMNSLPPDIGDIAINMPGADWRVALFMVAGAMVATAMFGVMPALQATRIDPVRTMRGEIIKDARPVRSRNLLIGLQVAAAALLLICSAIFLRSSLASTTVDPGYRTADTIMIDAPNETKREVLVQALRGDASIIAAGAMWPHLLGTPRAVSVQMPDTKIAAGYRMVSPEYFDILGIPVLRGRSFSAAEAAGQLPVAIINESLAATLYPGAEAIGQTIQLEPDPGARTVQSPGESPSTQVDEPALRSRTATIVGISKDVHGFRISDVREANLYLPIHTGVAKTHLLARIHGDPEQVRRTLLERLLLVDPNMSQILTMRTVARMEFYFLNLAFLATLVLGGLALAMTVSGLFSVLSYLVEQRTKEIGVRMALGATAKNVTGLVISQTSRPVLIGLAIGTSLVLALAAGLLSIPTAAPIGEVIHVLDPLAYAGSLAIIVAACLMAAIVPAKRASRVDPMKSLRQE